jgi:hypothetical protein
MVVEIPLATLDAGRMGWSNVPLWVVLARFPCQSALKRYFASQQVCVSDFRFGSRFTRSLRSSRTPAPSPADIRHDNQVVALRPMLSTFDRFRFLDKIRGWWRRSAKAANCRPPPAAQRQRCIGSGSMTAVVQRIRGHAVEHRRQRKSGIFLETQIFLGRFRKRAGRDRSLRSQRRLRDGRWSRPRRFGLERRADFAC